MIPRPRPIARIDESFRIQPATPRRGRRVTPSMRAALDDLRLDHLYLVVPGGPTYDLEPRVTVTALGELATQAADLR